MNNKFLLVSWTLALTLVAAAAVVSSLSSDVHFPDGSDGSLIKIRGKVQDRFGLPITHEIRVAAKQGDFVSGATAQPDALGDFEADVTLSGFVRSRPIHVVVLTGIVAAPGQSSANPASIGNDIFIDPAEGAGAFFSGGAAAQGGEFFLDTGVLQESQPPWIAGVDLSAAVPVPSRIVFENPDWGYRPYESLLSSTGIVSSLSGHLDLYSWGALGPLRVAIVSSEFGRIGAVEIQRGASVMLNSTGAGSVSGFISKTLYPTADFVLARPAIESIPQGSNATETLVLLTEDFQEKATCIIASDATFTLNGLAPGNYILEAWSNSSIATGPVAITPTVLANYAESPVVF